MNINVVSTNPFNSRRGRTLPSWLTEDSCLNSESQEKRSSSPELLKKDVVIKTEVILCDDAIGSSSGTITNEADPATIEQIQVTESIFVEERDTEEFIREEENAAAAVEQADSTNTGASSVHSDTDEVLTERKPFNQVDEGQVESSISAPNFSDNILTSADSSLPAPPTSTNFSIPNGRQICVYRHKCYRTNPQHKKDFSHPGDADYDGESECDSTSGNLTLPKPKCWYGCNCYRKSDEHKQRFYHSPPRTRKRNATQSRRGNTNSGNDSDEYEDSFIDDDSSEEFAGDFSSDEEGFSDFGNFSSSDDDSYRNSKKKKFSIL